jgi:DUF1680 family protein
MRKVYFKALLLLAIAALPCTVQAQDKGYAMNSVPFTAVHATNNSFWGQRLQASKLVTIPLALRKCDESGRINNFIKAAHPSVNNAAPEQPFDDTDVYKTLEGVAYLLSVEPDAKLEALADSLIDIIGAAQEKDGYIYTARTMNPTNPHPWCGNARWTSEENLSHETYNLGHLIESAIAYYQATGKDKYLKIAEAYADCTIREVGKGTGQIYVVPGHQIAEMALCKLYDLTGQQKYLDMAKYFLDERGYTATKKEYSQSQAPILQQTEAVGHAVRAGYMYTGIADVAALTGDQNYVKAIDRIWTNIVSKKMYITGGVGSTSGGEAYGGNYELPNETAYCETCAAISQVYFNYRMFLLHGEGKYFDVLERALYNGVIDGVSLDGGTFFYPNPLASSGQHARASWFGCPCCPGNIARFIPSVPGYVYTTHKDSLYVNLYMAGTADVTLNGKAINLQQTTDYPWNGDVKITVGTAADFTLKLRIPGWVTGEVVPSDLYAFADGKKLGFTVSVNGAEQSVTTSNGYVAIDRTWQAGDVVTLHLDMEPRLVKANSNVIADKGRLEVERGPLVYCAEWPDNAAPVNTIELKQDANFKPAQTDFKVGTDSYQLVTLTSDDAVMASTAGITLPTTLKLIPYYAWCHRGAGNMEVWIQKASDNGTAVVEGLNEVTAPASLGATKLVSGQTYALTNLLTKSTSPFLSEFTSGTAAQLGGGAKTLPVTVTLNEENGTWQISNATAGALGASIWGNNVGFTTATDWHILPTAVPDCFQIFGYNAVGKKTDYMALNGDTKWICWQSTLGSTDYTAESEDYWMFIPTDNTTTYLNGKTAYAATAKHYLLRVKLHSDLIAAAEYSAQDAFKTAVTVCNDETASDAQITAQIAIIEGLMTQPVVTQELTFHLDLQPSDFIPYDSDEPADMSLIMDKLGISSPAEATLYGYTPEGVWTNSSTGTPAPCFWLNQTGKVVAWGAGQSFYVIYAEMDKSYGNENLKAGHFYVGQLPGAWSNGETHKGTVYLVNQETGKRAAINLTVTVGKGTGIDGVVQSKTTGAEYTYDLTGRRVNTTAQRGVYIRNGKKFVGK